MPFPMHEKEVVGNREGGGNAIQTTIPRHRVSSPPRKQQQRQKHHLRARSIFFSATKSARKPASNPCHAQLIPAIAPCLLSHTSCLPDNDVNHRLRTPPSSATLATRTPQFETTRSLALADMSDGRGIGDDVALGRDRVGAQLALLAGAVHEARGSESLGTAFGGGLLVGCCLGSSAVRETPVVSPLVSHL